MPEARVPHRPEIDVLKGLAIIGVVCIHAKLGEGTLFFDYVINRSVPVFLFLFGVTSELWWARAPAEHRLKRWYAHRFKRLVVPFWGMAAVWWLAALKFGHPLPLGAKELAFTFLGYTAWIGTGWFVTLVLELVAVWPGLRWLVVRSGPWLALAAAALITAVSNYHALELVDLGRRLIGGPVIEPGWYYFWIFLPRVAWPVVAGLVLARLSGGRVGHRLAIAALLAVPLGVWVCEVGVRPDEFIVGKLRQLAAAHLFDVPLALALLGLLGWRKLPEIVGRPLAWCGRASWGIYLGHLLVHELVQFSGHYFFVGPMIERAIYAAILLGSGVLLAFSGAKLLELAGSRRSVATP